MLRTSLLTLFSCVGAIDSVWLSRPGDLAYCVGDDAIFTWNFNLSRDASVMIFTDSMTMNTIVEYSYGDGSKREHEEYIGRTDVPTHTQSTISVVLKAVTKDDTGEYMIELIGAVLYRDEAQLIVYTAEDLEPDIQLDNANVAPGTTVNITETSDVILSIATKHVRPASITIDSDMGGVLRSCDNSYSCEVVLSPLETIESSERLNIDVQYNGECDRLQRGFNILWPPGTQSGRDAGNDLDSDSSSTLWIVVGVLSLLVVLASVGVFVACLVIRNKPESAKSISDQRFVEFGMGVYRGLRCSHSIKSKVQSENPEDIELADIESEAVTPMLQEIVDGNEETGHILDDDGAQTPQMETTEENTSGACPAVVLEEESNIWREPRSQDEENLEIASNEIQTESDHNTPAEAPIGESTFDRVKDFEQMK